MSDPVELRDGKLWLHGMPLVDVADPRHHILYPGTQVPPQLWKKTGADAGAVQKTAAEFKRDAVGKEQ